MKNIPVFPRPDNIGLVQYMDQADNCFEFEMEKVACNKDTKDYIVQ